MSDPIISSTVAKSTNVSSERSETITRTLLVQVFGLSADAAREALRHYSAYRLSNAARILERAAAKSGSSAGNSIVNLRVAHVVLADGSYCDDELMADYLGGLLAGSRSPQGRDDRAVSWSKVITSLSALQIRAHYLLYREWAARLRIIGIYELGVDTGRTQATMEISSIEFAKLLVGYSGVDENDAMSHAVGGLIRVGLLGDSFLYNGRLVRVTPSIMGLELYGWAQGLPGLSPRGFASKAQLFEITTAIPRPNSVGFPKLPEHAKPMEHAGRRQVQAQRRVGRVSERGTSGSEPD
jgi:hypothetical protein